MPRMPQADRNAAFIPENFRDIYYCGTPEEVQALKDIAQKYGLHLLEKEYGCTYDYEAGVLLQSLHLAGVMQADAAGNCRYLHGYFFDDGSFSMPMELTVDLWPQTLLAELTYVRKDCLYPYTASVGLSEQLREWNYVTRDGQTLLAVWTGNMPIFLRTGKRHLSISTWLPTAWREIPGGKWSRRNWKKLQSALTIPLPPSSQFRQR